MRSFLMFGNENFLKMIVKAATQPPKWKTYIKKKILWSGWNLYIKKKEIP